IQFAKPFSQEGGWFHEETRLRRCDLSAMPYEAAQPLEARPQSAPQASHLSESFQVPRLSNLSLLPFGTLALLLHDFCTAFQLQATSHLCRGLLLDLVTRLTAELSNQPHQHDSETGASQTPQSPSDKK